MDSNRLDNFDFEQWYWVFEFPRWDQFGFTDGTTGRESRKKKHKYVLGWFEVVILKIDLGFYIKFIYKQILSFKI